MTYMWKSSRNLQMELPSPEFYGWIKNDILEPIMCLEPAAPMAMLALLKCACKTGCVSGSKRCGCQRNNLNCTGACSCGDCENQRIEA